MCGEGAPDPQGPCRGNFGAPSPTQCRPPALLSAEWVWLWCTRPPHLLTGLLGSQQPRSVLPCWGCGRRGHCGSSRPLWAAPARTPVLRLLLPQPSPPTFLRGTGTEDVGGQVTRGLCGTEEEAVTTTQTRAEGRRVQAPGGAARVCCHLTPGKAQPAPPRLRESSRKRRPSGLCGASRAGVSLPTQCPSGLPGHLLADRGGYIWPRECSSRPGTHRTPVGCQPQTPLGPSGCPSTPGFTGVPASLVSTASFSFHG